MPKFFCLLVLITFSSFVYSDDSTTNNAEQTSKKNPLIAAGLSQAFVYLLLVLHYLQV